MAPAASKRKPRENQYLFNVGVVGRKTGLTLPDTGIRDENGLEPMDGLFSSPEKPQSKAYQKVNGARKNANATLTSEEDMDEGDSTIPEPEAVLTDRKRASMRLPPPRSKSPIKTYLQSPARRNPSLGPVSSPVRGSIVAPTTASVSASVRRKLDFSNASIDDTSVVNGSSPQKRASSAMPVGRAAKLTSGSRLPPPRQAFSENGVDDERDDTGMENGEDSYQILDGGDEEEVGQVEEPEEEQEPEAEPEPEPTKKKMGRPKKQNLPVVQEEEAKPRKRTRQSLEGAQPVKNKGGRPKKLASQEEQPEEVQAEERPAKRTRRSLDTSEASTTKGGKPKKTPAAAPAAANPPKAKPAGRNPKLATISEADSPQVQRGPPMPRTNRGLVILRRETPMEGSGFKQTRSGRNSIKPVAYWKNERIEYTEDENEDNWGKSKFLLPTIKEVVRADEVAEPKRHKSKYKPSKSKKRHPQPESEDEEDEVEPWETEPGHIFGEIRNWDPEDQLGSMAEEREEELAISSAAIITREIPGASFKFAKTLTHPFFGSGMVDLPAGAVKKPKNSRKMQMVFFVFSGRVQVNVNDNEFRIGKGGMWQVPRGNFYSIVNDYDKPARIFFAQGCEVQEEIPDSQ